MSNILFYLSVACDLLVIGILIFFSFRRGETVRGDDEFPMRIPNEVETLRTALADIEARVVKIAHAVKEYEDGIVEYSLKLEREKKGVQTAIADALAVAKTISPSHQSLVAEQPPARQTTAQAPPEPPSRPSEFSVSADDAVSPSLGGGDVATAKKGQPFVQKNRNFEVINLFRQGRDMNDISRTLGIAKGEIELILSLNKDKTI